MPIKSSGAISFSDIRAEMGPAGTGSMNLGSYRGIAPGIPTNGDISLSDFYGKSFFVTEIITSGSSWAPKLNFARFIHIFVVGAGGSGGSSWPRSGFTDGVGAASGGGAGGVAYSRIPRSQAALSSISIGVGGAGVRSVGESTSTQGNPGTNTTFTGSGLVMVGNGGSRGNAANRTDGGTTSISVAGALGGTATGGNQGNFTGGSSGAASISTSGVGKVASGGGAPAFQSAHNALKNAQDASGQVGTPGALVSGYGSWPTILSTYQVSRGQSAVLASNVLSFDGTSGKRNEESLDATFGAGSGGIAASGSTLYSGRGGNGVIIIVYEI